MNDLVINGFQVSIVDNLPLPATRGGRPRSKASQFDFKQLKLNQAMSITMDTQHEEKLVAAIRNHVYGMLNRHGDRLYRMAVQKDRIVIKRVY